MCKPIFAYKGSKDFLNATVLLTGDYLNTDASGAENALRFIAQEITAPGGMFAIAGNWDAREWSRAMPILADEGVQRVDGEMVALLVNGVNLRLFGGLGKVLQHERPGRSFDILLEHTPDLIEEAAGIVDLYLCGHTHGGQVRVPLLGAVVTLSKFWKRYEMGLYTVNGTTLYVNRGIGMEGGTAPRVRFLAPPEIAVLDIVGKE